ncbi:MAG: TonB-dependent receptor [Salinivirgaceae bacterium]|nr:TonB-dependent receptor [Salinivirgaceae bacterium]
MPQKKAIELAAYVSNEHKVLPYLTLKYGLRLSGFVNYDCDSVYFYDQNYAEVKQDSYTNKFFGSYMHLEPRLGFVYLLSETASIKGSYTRNAQYLQLAQNSNAGTPLDIWFSSSNNVKPQVADQVALGYFNNFFENRIEGSIELFYKNMQNTIDFKDFSTTIMNEKIEGELRYGTSRAYGAEFLVRYNFDKLTGWVSYTLSKSERKIDEVNEGKTYVAPFDKPHDVSIVANYEFNKRHNCPNKLKNRKAQ